MAEPIPKSVRYIAVLRDWRVAIVAVSVRRTAVDAPPPPEQPAPAREPVKAAGHVRTGRFVDGEYWRA